jgi:plastocyanin
VRRLKICSLALGAALAFGACSSSTTPTPAASTGPAATSAPAASSAPANSAPPAASTAASAPAGGGAGTAVEIKDRAFNPSDLSVKVGAKVTWTNNDSIGHTVTFDTGGNKSDTLSNGATYDFTFTTAGTFPYHCSIHPDMTARVTVAP